MTWNPRTVLKYVPNCPDWNRYEPMEANKKWFPIRYQHPTTAHVPTLHLVRSANVGWSIFQPRFPDKSVREHQVFGYDPQPGSRLGWKHETITGVILNMCMRTITLNYDACGHTLIGHDTKGTCIYIYVLYVYSNTYIYIYSTSIWVIIPALSGISVLFCGW